MEYYKEYTDLHKDKELMDRLHMNILDILLEIDRICKKYEIQWWLQSGTLLGAVRHQGFIPWDDDCDIGMMRSDFEKFVKVAATELREEFFLQSKDTDPFYNRRRYKVRKKGTKLVEHDENENEKHCQGIFVDIFVWDYYYGWEKSVVDAFNIMPRLRTKRLSYRKHSFKRMVHGILTAIPYAIHKALENGYLGFRKIVRTQETLPFVSYEAETGNGVFFEHKDLFPLRYDVLFEGYSFPIIRDYHKCLTDMYGDYMQLPPPEKRHTHARIIEC